MEKIGVVATHSSTQRVEVILLEGYEKKVKSEEIVLIDNSGEEVLGILRNGKGVNDLLNPNTFKPSVSYAKIGGDIPSEREIYSFEFITIGIIEKDGIKQNKKIIKPGSPVYLLDKNPFDSLKNQNYSYMDAYLEGHADWKILVDTRHVNQHMGIFGTTGAGKSWLARYVLVPFYIENGYSVLILDWDGYDYVKYFENTIPIFSIKLSKDSIYEYLNSKTDKFFGSRILQNLTMKFLSETDFTIFKDSYEAFESFKEYLDNNKSTKVEDYHLELTKIKLRPEDFDPLIGAKYEVSEIIENLKQYKILVIDLSEANDEKLKLSLFLSISEELKRRMKKESKLKIALLIDEAPQYAPFNPSGIQERVVEELRQLAATGRKHELSLTLIAQGVAGEIGIHASIRRNLNTNFYGKIHPLDATGQGGAKEMLQPFGITPETLLNLEEGHFYISGNMNIFPVPLLITFKPKNGN